MRRRGYRARRGPGGSGAADGSVVARAGLEDQRMRLAHAAGDRALEPGQEAFARNLGKTFQAEDRRVIGQAGRARSRAANSPMRSRSEERRVGTEWGAEGT